MSKVEDRLLYFNSPEIFAAVHSIGDIAAAYFKRAVEEPEAARESLHDNLIAFFAKYDRMRTDEIECLKKRLTEALMQSVRPMQSGPVK